MNSHNILDLVDRIGLVMRQQQREVGGQLDLQPIHLQVLSYLSSCNDYSNTPHAVTKFFGATKGTISQTIAVLQKKGFVKKTVDPKDKRVTHLCLTKKSEKALHTYIAETDLTKMVAKVSAGELETTEKVLTKLLREMQAANDNQTFGQCYTCKHFIESDKGDYQCGITQESLSEAAIVKICLEHEIK